MSSMVSMVGYIAQLKREGILKKVEESPLTRKNGVILVGCGDCDRFPELVKYQYEINKSTNGASRVHQLTLNGGALLLHRDSPLNKDHDSSMTMIYHLKKSAPLKDISDVALYGHFECGAAKDARLTPEQHFEWLAKAAENLSKIFPNLNIACKFHFEKDSDPNKPFATHYFDHSEWLYRHIPVHRPIAAGMSQNPYDGTIGMGASGF